MSTTNVLITGANRGAGLALIKTYLARPNHTVIGAVRDVAGARAKGLEDIPAAPGSKLVLVKIESTSFTDPSKAVEQIASLGITKLDVVIANAAIADTEVVAAADGDAEDFAKVLLVNAVGPLALFAAMKPLLELANNPKWVAISTSSASMTSHGAMFEFMGRRPLGFGYGASKAALNHLGLSIHAENPNLIVLLVDPGLLDTEMGNRVSDIFSVPKPPTDILDTAKAIMKLVDAAKRETHSGKLLTLEGKEVPW